MPTIRSVAHFAIPVSDMGRSIDFYCEVVGCTLLRRGTEHTFLDAGGTCVLLSLQKPPINPAGQFDLVHHAFDIGPEQFESISDHLSKHGVKILYSEIREGGTVNGPRLYFRDPDGTRLEFINLTKYDRENRKSPQVTHVGGERHNLAAPRAR